MEFGFYFSPLYSVPVRFPPAVPIRPHLSLLLTSPVLCLSSLFQGGPASKLGGVSVPQGGRHLLGFSPETESEVAMGPDRLRGGPSDMADR